MDLDDQENLVDAFFQAKSARQLFLAVELGREILRMLPESSAWQYLYAEQLRGVGRLRAAEQLLIAMHSSNPAEESRRLICLARIYEAQGMLSEARTAFQDATKALPSDTMPWIHLGAFQMRRERFAEAISSLKRGLTAEGDLDEAHCNLGACHAALDEFDEAEREYRAAIDLDPEYQAAKEALADIIALKEFRNQRTEKGENRKRDIQDK